MLLDFSGSTRTSISKLISCCALFTTWSEWIKEPRLEWESDSHRFNRVGKIPPADRLSWNAQMGFLGKSQPRGILGLPIMFSGLGKIPSTDHLTQNFCTRFSANPAGEVFRMPIMLSEFYKIPPAGDLSQIYRTGFLGKFREPDFGDGNPATISLRKKHSFQTYQGDNFFQPRHFSICTPVEERNKKKVSFQKVWGKMPSSLPVIDPCNFARL